MVYGNSDIREQLARLASGQTVSHAQILIGPEGSGGLPVALEYARLILKAYRSESVTEESIDQRIEHWNYPDLHFSFPVAKLRTDHKPRSDDFMQAWKTFVSQTPYGRDEDWQQLADASKKNWFIGKDEALHIAEKTRLKAFEGGAKVMIIWLAEAMNPAAANTLLKLLEEPPPLTFFLLVTHRPEQILPTIMSRCVSFRLKPLSPSEITEALVAMGAEETPARSIALQAGGSLRKALSLVEADEDLALFQERFVHWVRWAFRANKDPQAIRHLLSWGEELAAWERTRQVNFLNYCSDVFAWALHRNYGMTPAGEPDRLGEDFELSKFAPFVHENNIEDIHEEIERGLLHLKRFVNAKVVFSDLSVRMTRYLHRPSA